KQYNGKYDYKAFGNTLNISPNSCNIQTQSSAVFNLSPSQNLISAYLYWSGSGGLINDTFPGDYEVNLNGITVSAERTFINNLQNNKFYGAFADVTDILNNFGNGTYTVSNFDLTGNIFPGSPYCNNQTDFGGWTITVVYQDNSLPLNQVNLFDGFESVSQFNNNLTIQLTTLNVMDNMGAKIGFLAWEGDASLAVNETLRINGNILSNPPLNPQTNAFNGTNSFTNSSQLYNMDIDFYNIENYIQPGDVSASISLTSGQDYIIVNNIITVLNSELPDATISFENIEIICNNLVEINYTVFNINSTGILPAGTPIKFYLEENQIGQAFTENDLPIDGQETGSITLTIPINTVPDPFTIKVVVDDGGGGISTVTEINEDNNEFEQIISLAEVVLNLTLDADILITNDDAICEGEDQVIGINSLTPPIAAGENSTYQWFFNGTLMPGETDEQLIVNQTGTYQLEVTYEGCIVTDDILVEFIINPIAGAPTPLIECDQTPNDGIAEFNLTEADTDIINGQTNNLVTYHETLAQAEAGIDALVSPYTNTVPNTQTIFARLEEDVLGCYDVTQLVLQVNPAPSITDPISDYQLCDNDGDGSETFDLTSKYDEIVNTLTDITLTYYNTEADANADTNAIVTPSAYISSGTETIWVRLSDNFTQCYTIGNFQIETIFCPLPDATVSINNDLYACRNRDLIIEYRVNNIDGTDILPAFTPISFYLDEILVTQTQTLNDIPINGSETNSIEINLPINTPNLFEILIRVDDLGFNEGIIEELDELNNEYSVSIEFGSLPPILPLSNLIECDEGNESANFNLTQQNNSISTNINDIITFYVSEEDANLNENEITDTGNYQNTSNPQTIYIRLENEICFTTSSFEIETENCIPFIPEGFSPNNDNINDVFEIDHLLNIYLDFELKIFSRYGNIIYKGTHEDGFWDGISNEGITFKHQLVPTGVYIYVLQLNDYRYPDSFIGTVYINY
ncbi:MAG: gliding motility-associated C-terminal domain-containing protein, partial [Flavobacteriaceae bacterium]|nr:gliding motility-associated C-terminal domain-containing protein [Flavobacteriaceae bacterium]